MEILFPHKSDKPTEETQAYLKLIKETVNKTTFPLTPKYHMFRPKPIVKEEESRGTAMLQVEERSTQNEVSQSPNPVRRSSQDTRNANVATRVQMEQDVSEHTNVTIVPDAIKQNQEQTLLSTDIKC